MKMNPFLFVIITLTYIPIVLFYNKLLVPKQSKLKTFILFSTIRLALNLLTFYIQFLVPYRAIINFGIDLILAMALYKDKFSKKLFSVLGVFITLMMVDYACFFLFQTVPSLDENVKYYLSYFSFLVCEQLVLLFVANYIGYMTDLDDKKTFAAFILIPISQILMIGLLSYQSMPSFVTTTSEGTMTFSGSSSFAFTLVAVSLLSLCADFVFMRIAYKSAISRQERNQLEILEKESEINYAYYSELQANADEMRKYRHDVNNIIQTIYVLMNNPDEQSSEDIKKTLKSLEDEINAIRLKKYCSNNLINSILAVNEKRFTASGISCDIKAAIPESVGIPELDMCRLFTNILDNAYNAMCDETGTRQELELEAHVSDGHLYISESNTCPDTQKPVKPGHGLGLKIIEEIANKHDGYYKTQTQNGRFSIQIAVREGISSPLKISTAVKQVTESN